MSAEQGPAKLADIDAVNAIAINANILPIFMVLLPLILGRASRAFNDRNGSTTVGCRTISTSGMATQSGKTKGPAEMLVPLIFRGGGTF